MFLKLSIFLDGCWFFLVAFTLFGFMSFALDAFQRYLCWLQALYTWKAERLWVNHRIFCWVVNIGTWDFPLIWSDSVGRTICLPGMHKLNWQCLRAELGNRAGTSNTWYEMFPKSPWFYMVTSPSKNLLSPKYKIFLPLSRE